MPLILPNTLANEIPADGEKLEQNFNTIEDWANQDAITADGSTGMTAPLLLPGMPTQPLQAATKSYVDSRTPRALALVQTNTEVTNFTLPIDPYTRTYVIAWSWFSWGHNANGTLGFQLLAGTNILGSISVPFAASAPPVPTFGTTHYFQYTQLANAAPAALKVSVTGGTGAWFLNGYLHMVGYPELS